MIAKALVEAIMQRVRKLPHIAAAVGAVYS
jgi:hypothetical protein